MKSSALSGALKVKKLASSAADWISGLDLDPSFRSPRSSSPEPTLLSSPRTEEASPSRALPWSPRNAAERRNEVELRSLILRISQTPDAFLLEGEGEALGDEDAARAVELGGVALQVDDALRKMRYHLVPRQVSEELFWKRYYVAVEKVREKLLQDHPEHPRSPKPSTSGKQRARTAMSESGWLHADTALSGAQLLHMSSALETAKGFASMRELFSEGKISKLSRDGRQLGGLRRAVEAGKSIGKSMLDRKKGQATQQQITSCVWDLFDPEATLGQEYVDSYRKALPSTYRLAPKVNGAHLGSFLPALVRQMASLGTMGEMCTLWTFVLDEIKWHWSNLKPIPRIPVEKAPELTACLLHQNLMLLNCCIARKARARQRTRAKAAGKARAGQEETCVVKLHDGTECVRKGHVVPIEGLFLLHAPHVPVYKPEIQDSPVLTEELMLETDEMIMKTGSVGPGLKQLMSDIQAFKAANPGCVLADFVRWYSPADWIQGNSDGSEGSGVDSQLSSRMREPGNMWTTMFDQAQAIAAADQNPLFDFDYTADILLDGLTGIAPSDLFEQLFLVAVVLRHARLEDISLAVKAQSPESQVMAAVQEAEAFATSTCCRGMSASKVAKICSAYDTTEEFIVKCEAEVVGTPVGRDDEPDEWTIL